MNRHKLQLVVGLGNPGVKYEETRHNIGFALVERLAEKFGVQFTRHSKFHADVTRVKGAIGEADLWLLRPATFMNLSGQAVAALANFYRIAPESVLVAHDELDLPPGGIRLKHGGGHAGHNGLKDIVAKLGSVNFWRLRLGIGHPRDIGSPQEVASYVLQRPLAEEVEALESALELAADTWPKLAAGDFTAAQRVLHAPHPQPDKQKV